MSEQRLDRAKDTSPLEPDELSDEEVRMFIRIERYLGEARQWTMGIKAPAASNARLRHLAHVEVRAPRVLLLDGERGTGKTSLLLTLARRWNPSREPDEALGASYNRRFRRFYSSESKGDDDRPGFVIVPRILDFDPLPPDMPLAAGIIQALRPLADRLEEVSRDSLIDDERQGTTLLDLWHQLFRVAAVGWTPIPRATGLIEQVLDREEQVGDWQDLGERWREFVDGLISSAVRHKEKVVLPDDNAPLFVIMIDDVDLQVERARELLPALRMLYHPAVVFLVACHRRHLLEMLKLEFLGRQRGLAKDIGGEGAVGSSRHHWAEDLARAAFEKVFPRNNRWQLHPLTLSQVLDFPGGAGTLRRILNSRTWPEIKEGASDAPKSGGPERVGLGDYLHRMGTEGAAITSQFLPLMTYRTCQQLLQDIPVDPEARNVAAARVLRGILAPTDAEDIVPAITESDRERPLEFRLTGEISALYIEELTESIQSDAEIVLSSRPDFAYQQNPTSEALQMSSSHPYSINFTSALAAISLQDSGYGVEARGLKWEIRLALAWTRWAIDHRTDSDIRKLSLSFRWQVHEHPTPAQLLEWTGMWSRFIRGLAAVDSGRKLDRFAYAWVYYQLRILSVEVPASVLDPLDRRLDLSGAKPWEGLLRLGPRDVEGLTKWRKATLPLLARPEIGLTPFVQRQLLRFIEVRDVKEKERLRDQRRRLVTDAILAAAAELRVAAERAEDEARVKGAIREIDKWHSQTWPEGSPWQSKIERSKKTDQGGSARRRDKK